MSTNPTQVNIVEPHDPALNPSSPDRAARPGHPYDFEEQAFESKKDEAVDLAAENAKLQRQLAEELYKREYAEKMGQQIQQRPSVQEKEPEPEKEPVVDMVELEARFNDVMGDTENAGKRFVTEVMPLALQAVKKQAGLVTEADVDRKITAKEQAIRRQQEETSLFIGKHPGLGDFNSPLFRQTSVELGELNSDPQYQSLPDIAKLEMATLRAESSLARGGVETRRQERAEDDRDTRINRQMGPAPSSKSTPAKETLTESQKFMARKFGMTEDEYIAEAKLGIEAMRPITR